MCWLFHCLIHAVTAAMHFFLVSVHMYEIAGNSPLTPVLLGSVYRLLLTSKKKCKSGVEDLCILQIDLEIPCIDTAPTENVNKAVNGDTLAFQMSFDLI